MRKSQLFLDFNFYQEVVSPRERRLFRFSPSTEKGEKVDLRCHWKRLYEEDTPALCVCHSICDQQLCSSVTENEVFLHGQR